MSSSMQVVLSLPWHWHEPDVHSTGHKMSLSTTIFGLHVEMASLEAIEEMMAEASSPKAPYDSATMGTHTHPSSEHLRPLAWCFLASVI